MLLLSDLFGSFADRQGSWRACAGHYGRLREAGVEVVFFSGAPLEVALRTLDGLNPEAALVADDGKTLWAPAGHRLGSASEPREIPVPGAPGQRAAAEWVIERYGYGERLVLHFGIGGGAADAFLEAVEVAALLPGEDGRLCPEIPKPGIVCVCKETAQSGWNEWAETMLRRIELVGMRD